MTSMTNPTRQAELRRETKETTVALSLTIDGSGATSVSTGIPFFDHMLEQLGKHAGFDLRIEAKGDLDVEFGGKSDFGCFGGFAEPGNDREMFVMSRGRER